MCAAVASISSRSSVRACPGKTAPKASAAPAPPGRAARPAATQAESRPPLRRTADAVGAGRALDGGEGLLPQPRRDLLATARQRPLVARRPVALDRDPTAGAAQPVRRRQSLDALIEGAAGRDAAALDPVLDRQPIGRGGAGQELQQLVLVLGVEDAVADPGVDERPGAEAVALDAGRPTLERDPGAVQQLLGPSPPAADEHPGQSSEIRS